MKRRMRKAEDAAGVGPDVRDRDGLVALSELRGWNVMDRKADIRGWEVQTLSGRQLGAVRELLVDPAAGEVVMIAVDLANSGRHALVQLRLAELDRARRVVRIDSGDLEPVAASADDVDEARLSLDELARVRQGATDTQRRGDRPVARTPVVDGPPPRRRASDRPEDRV